MTLDVGTLVAHLRTDDTHLKRGLDKAERDVQRSGDRMGTSFVANALRWAGQVVKTWRDAGKQAVGSFFRDANGRLHDGLGRFVAEAGGAGVGGVFKLFSSGAGIAGTAAVNLTTNLLNLIPALLAVAAALTVVGPVALLAGGALGAIPALAVGGLGAVGALALGFTGLGDAFKKTAVAGGSVVDRAYQIAVAERRVRDANREVIASQEAINRARRQAAEDLEDLNRSLVNARMDEESAVLAVAEAERELVTASRSRDPDRFRRAALTYRQAEQAVLDVRDRVADLTQEQENATRKGVEGSDVVVAAMERQAAAIEGVADAQHALAQAQRAGGGGGGASAEVTRLAASAAEAVAAIKALKPAFEILRLDVQQRLFAGVAAEIRALSAAWLPTLRARLGGTAAVFNGLFRDLAANSRRPEFISNISAGWQSVDRLIDRVGRSITGPFLGAWGRLARVATPFIDTLGEGLSGVVDDFSRWIERAEKSGALDQFFRRSARFLRDAGSIGKSTLRILGSVISILLDSNERVRDWSTGTLVDQMDRLAGWFDDPANQAKIRGWLDRIQEVFFWIKDVAIPTVVSWVATLDRWADRVGGWIGKVQAFRDGVTSAFGAVTGAVAGMQARIAEATSGMWDGLKSSFRNALNWIIWKWNGLSFGVGGGSFLGIAVPAARFDTPDIPYLADGGVVRATAGGRLARIAEGGQDEAVAPLATLDRMIRAAVAGGGSGGGTLKIVLEGTGIMRGIRRTARVGGGRTHTVLVGA